MTMTITNIKGQTIEIPLKADTTEEQAVALAKTFASNPNVDPALTIICY